MAKIIYGFMSFGLGIASVLLTAAIIAILYIFPPATYLFKQMFYASFVPMIVSLVGLLCYYIQWRIFTTRIVYAGLIINLAVLLTDAYLMYGLYNSI